MAKHFATDVAGQTMTEAVTWFNADIILTGTSSITGLALGSLPSMTLAELNGLVSDATLDDASTARTPLSHTLASHTGILAIAAGGTGTATPNDAFNKSFGALAGDVAEGDDARLSDARTPTSHTLASHTGILAIAAGGTGTATPETGFNKAFGTIAGSVSEGNHAHANAIDGTGVANKLAVWDDANTLSDSALTDSGTELSTAVNFKIAKEISLPVPEFAVEYYHNTLNAAPQLRFERRTGDFVNYNRILSGGRAGSILFQGWGGNGTINNGTLATIAEINIEATQTHTENTARGTQIRFSQINQDTGAISDSMLLDSAGNVRVIEQLSVQQTALGGLGVGKVLTDVAGNGLATWVTPGAGGGGDFTDGGDAFGANASLGNNSAFDMIIKANNATRLTAKSAGGVDVVGDFNSTGEISGSKLFGGTITSSFENMAVGVDANNLIAAFNVYSTTPSHHSIFKFGKSRGTTASPLQARSGDNIATVSFEGRDNAASPGNSRVGASITVTASGDITTALHPMTMNFNTNAIGEGAAPSARLKITGTGDVQVTNSLDAQAYTVNGVAGANFGPGAVTSITVVNGIVTAIS